MDSFSRAVTGGNQTPDVDRLYEQAMNNPAAFQDCFERDVPDNVLTGCFGFSNSAELDTWQKKVDAVLIRMGPAQMLTILKCMQAQSSDCKTDRRQREIAEAVCQEIVDMADKKYPHKIHFEHGPSNDYRGIADVLARQPGIAANVEDVLMVESGREEAPAFTLA